MKKKSNNSLYIYIIILVGVIILTPNIYHLVNLNIEYNRLLNEKNQQSNDTDLLQTEIDKRETDEKYLETLAYRDFQMVKDGEKIYRIQDSKQVED